MVFCGFLCCLMDPSLYIVQFFALTPVSSLCHCCRRGLRVPRSLPGEEKSKHGPRHVVFFAKGVDIFNRFLLD